jgi:hypothetical protein
MTSILILCWHWETWNIANRDMKKLWLIAASPWVSVKIYTISLTAFVQGRRTCVTLRPPGRNEVTAADVGWGGQIHCINIEQRMRGGRSRCGNLCRANGHGPELSAFYLLIALFSRASKENTTGNIKNWESAFYLSQFLCLGNDLCRCEFLRRS